MLLFHVPVGRESQYVSISNEKKTITDDVFLFLLKESCSADDAMRELQSSAIVESTYWRTTMECQKFKWIKYESEFTGIFPAATIRSEWHSMDE